MTLTTAVAPAARAALLIFAPLSLAAQPGPLDVRPGREQDKQVVYRLLDSIRASVDAGDWNGALRLANRLNSSVFLRSRAGPAALGLELMRLEDIAGRDAMTRAPLLPRLARAAFAAREWTKAETYAHEAIESARSGVFWWTGDAVHHGNIILGRLALRRYDSDEAERRLIAAARTPGSPLLSIFGPDMTLARDLLVHRRSEVVIQFIEECRGFWPETGKLAVWATLLRAGVTPDFGPYVE